MKYMMIVMVVIVGCNTGRPRSSAADAGSVVDAVDTTFHGDPNSVWNLYIEHVNVPPLKPDGTSWDPSGGAPDPFAVAFYGDPVSAPFYSNDTGTDTYEASFFVADGPVLTATAGELLTFFQIDVYDDDGDRLDVERIGACRIALGAYDFTGDSVRADCPADDGVPVGPVTIYYHFRRSGR